MPTNASVYQPTTVTFENTSGTIFPHQTTTTSRLKAAFRKPWMKILLLVGSLFFIALGLILMVSSFADYEDALANEDIVSDMSIHEKNFDIVLMILGAFFTIFGICLMGEYCLHDSLATNEENFWFYRGLYKSDRLLAQKLCRMPLLIS